MSGAAEVIRKLGLNTRQADVLTTKFKAGRYSFDNPTMCALNRRGLVSWARPYDIRATGHWMRTADGNEAVKAITAALTTSHGAGVSDA